MLNVPAWRTYYPQGRDTPIDATAAYLLFRQTYKPVVELVSGVASSTGIGGGNGAPYTAANSPTPDSRVSSLSWVTYDETDVELSVTWTNRDNFGQWVSDVGNPRLYSGRWTDTGADNLMEFAVSFVGQYSADYNSHPAYHLQLSLNAGTDIAQTADFAAGSGRGSMGSDNLNATFSVSYDVFQVGGDPVDVWIRTLDEYGQRSSWVHFKLGEVLAQMGALWHTDGALYTAINGDGALVISRQATPQSSTQMLTTIPGVKNACLWQKRAGQKRTGTLELAARSIATGLWAIFRSLNKTTWTMIGTPFQSTSIDYLDAAPLGNGGVACAIIKGTPNQLVFKQTADVTNWPPDSEAKPVRSGVANKPVRVMVEGERKRTFSITGVGLPWLQSKDGVKWE